MAGSRPDRYEKERAAWLRAGNGQLIASRMRRVDLLDRAVSRRDLAQHRAGAVLGRYLC